MHELLRDGETKQRIAFRIFASRGHKSLEEAQACFGLAGIDERPTFECNRLRIRKPGSLFHQVIEGLLFVASNGRCIGGGEPISLASALGNAKSLV